RAGAHHRRDHRDHTRHFHLLAEELAGAGEEGSGRLLDTSAGGVEQPDEGHPLLQGDLAQAADLELTGHPHRAGHHGEVVGGDAAGATVDVAPAGDHAVGGRLDVVHRALGEVRAAVEAELDEAALVDQQVDALAGGELAALVLLGDLLLTTGEAGGGAALVELVVQLGEWGGAGQQMALLGGIAHRMRPRRVSSTRCVSYSRPSSLRWPCWAAARPWQWRTRPRSK